jgi:hypothetical protein
VLLYVGVFNVQMPPSSRPPDDDKHYLPAEPKKSALSSDALSEEINIILGRLNSFGTDMERVEFIMEDKGLGPLPAKLDSVGSLLLFNSDINPYKDYQTLDNLLSSGRLLILMMILKLFVDRILPCRAKTVTDEDGKSNLASAPMSLLNGDALPDIGGIDITFKPEMGDMAALALPSNLPLDFIAGKHSYFCIGNPPTKHGFSFADIHYSGAALPSIAPSVTLKSNYSLPQITDGGLYSPAPSAKQPSAPPPPPPVASGPPPPPSGPPPAPSGPPPAPSGPPPPPSSSGPPPPPTQSTGPPLPPPSAPAAPASSMNDIDDDDDGDAPGSGGGAPRSGLLDAIRVSVNCFLMNLQYWAEILSICRE